MTAPGLEVRRPSADDLRAMVAILQDPATNQYARAVLLREVGTSSEREGLESTPAAASQSARPWRDLRPATRLILRYYAIAPEDRLVGFLLAIASDDRCTYLPVDDVRAASQLAHNKLRRAADLVREALADLAKIYVDDFPALKVTVRGGGGS